MGSSKSGSAVVGYWYHMDMQAVVCHGPVDQVVEIRAGERTAWSGSVTGNTELTIDNPHLFGGESREGGWQGKIDMLFGGSGQIAPTALVDSVAETGSTTPVPAYRGVLSMFFKGLTRAGFAFAAMNPYFKPFAVKVRRYATWYPAKAKIGNDANPVHVIYECLTNREWGMGYPSTIIDDAQFQAAADTLHSEGFGISLLWEQSTQIEAFVLDVLKIINASLNQDRTTGELFLKLVRDDYDVGTLPVFDPDNCNLASFARAGSGDIANEVTLVYTDATTGEDASITVQNLASILDQGRVIAQKIEMPGIRDPDIAAKVAQRELQARTRGLAKVTLETSRAGYTVYDGDAIKLNWPALGISGMVLRVSSIDVGDLESASIRIEAVEDVFGLPSVSYVASPGSGWVDNSATALPVSVQRAVELPYYLVVLNTTSAERAELASEFGFAALLARAPQSNSVNYALLTSPDGSTYTEDGSGDWTPAATLAADIGFLDTTITLTGASRFELANPDEFILVGNEIMQIVSISYPSVTVRRGVLDTLPEEHTTGDVAWLMAPGLYGLNSDTLVSGETTYFKALTRAPQAILAQGSAPAVSLTLANRFERPYPPGNVKIDGLYFPAAAVSSDDIPVTWAHRDRTQQTATPLLEWTAGDVGPEAGVAYNLRVYEGVTMIEEYTGLTGTSQTILPNAGGPYSGSYRVELESVRAGITSAVFDHTFTV